MCLNQIPIENLWPEVRDCSSQPSNLVELERFAFEEWNNMLNEICIKLLNSCIKCLKLLTKKVIVY